MKILSWINELHENFEKCWKLLAESSFSIVMTSSSARKALAFWTKASWEEFCSQSLIDSRDWMAKIFWLSLLRILKNGFSWSSDKIFLRKSNTLLMFWPRSSIFNAVFKKELPSLSTVKINWTISSTLRFSFKTSNLSNGSAFPKKWNKMFLPLMSLYSSIVVSISSSSHSCC